MKYKTWLSINHTRENVLKYQMITCNYTLNNSKINLIKKKTSSFNWANFNSESSGTHKPHWFTQSLPTSRTSLTCLWCFYKSPFLWLLSKQSKVLHKEPKYAFTSLFVHVSKNCFPDCDHNLINNIVQLITYIFLRCFSWTFLLLLLWHLPMKWMNIH